MKKGSLSNAEYRPIAKINQIYTKTLLNTDNGTYGLGKDLHSQDRILVLAYHASMDREMTMLLSYYFSYRHNRKEIWELQDLVLDKLGFEIKRQLIKRLNFFNGDKEIYKKLAYLNHVRNAVAHSEIWENPTIKASNEKILTKKQF
jgi:hypothetical protein